MTDKMTRDEVLAVLERDAIQAVQWRTMEGENVFALASQSDDAREVVSALYDEVEAQQRWIAHLRAFIGPGAMPGLRASFEAGLPAGGADQRIKGGA